MNDNNDGRNFLFWLFLYDYIDRRGGLYCGPRKETFISRVFGAIAYVFKFFFYCLLSAVAILIILGLFYLLVTWLDTLFI